MIFGWKNSPEWVRIMDERRHKRAEIAVQRNQIEMQSLMIEANQEAFLQMLAEQENRKAGQ